MEHFTNCAEYGNSSHGGEAVLGRVYETYF